MTGAEHRRPAWPPWYGFAALLMALALVIVAQALLAAFVGLDSRNELPDGAVLALTVVQNAAFVGFTLFMAAQVRPPRPADFGLRTTPLMRAIGWMVAAAVLYVVASQIYIAAFDPDTEQTTLKDLGAGSGAAITAFIGVLVVGVAPVAEELLFRGFMYGALRTRLPVFAAAAIAGITFGGLHAPTGIGAVPPLIFLGFALCLLYEVTGSLIPPIALHALNNMLAFGSDENGSWLVAAVTAGVVVTACVTLPGRSRTLKPDAARGA